MRRAGRAALAGLVTGTLLLASCGDEPPYQNLSVQSSSERHVAATAEESAAGAALVTDLAGELYPSFARAAGDDGLGDVVFSPVALAAVLGQLHLGAQGASAEQLAELLGPIEGEVGLDRAINGAVEPVRDPSGSTADASGQLVEVDLEVGAEVFGQSGLDWEDDHVDALQVAYDAELPNVDFADAPDHGRAELNQRVADASADQVRELVADGAIDADTRLVGTAAAGVVGPWHAPLADEGPATFTRPDGTTVEVPMVGGEVGGRYILADDWQSVTLPLAGQHQALTLILPDEGKLRAVQDDLATVIAEATEDGPKLLVGVSFPAFAVASDLDVPDALARAGVEAPFADAGTDFEPMTDDEPLRLDGLFHQAGLVVGADGVRSTPAEGTPAAEPLGPGTSTGLRIDRTFLFVLHDAASGTPILVGRVSDPSS